jgi:hypothetical protein
METEVLKMAKKAIILRQILANYQQEKQALIQRDLSLLSKTFQQRTQYIRQLKEMSIKSSTSPLFQLQKQNIHSLIQKIQKERQITQLLSQMLL